MLQASIPADSVTAGADAATVPTAALPSTTGGGGGGGIHLSNATLGGIAVGVIAFGVLSLILGVWLRRRHRDALRREATQRRVPGPLSSKPPALGAAGSSGSGRGRRPSPAQRHSGASTLRMTANDAALFPFPQPDAWQANPTARILIARTATGPGTVAGGDAKAAPSATPAKRLLALKKGSTSGSASASASVEKDGGSARAASTAAGSSSVAPQAVVTANALHGKPTSTVTPIKR
jgi:hypothetical protein